MKRILILLLGILLSQPALAALTSSNVPTHTHANAAQGGNTLGGPTLTGTLSSTKACATGYTRTLPNYCAANAAVTVSVTTDSVCNQTAAISGVTDARAVNVSIRGDLWGSALANTVRSILFRSFGATNSTCAGNEPVEIQYSLLEVSATSGFIGNAVFNKIIRTSSSGRSYYIASKCAAANCALLFFVEGYFD